MNEKFSYYFFFFSEFGLLRKYILIAEWFDKPSHIWEKSGFWDIGQNGIGQSDCRVLKWTLTLEQSHEKAWFFVSSYKFIEIKSWLKNIGVGVVIRGSIHSGHRILILTISQNEKNRIKKFLVYWHEYRKAKSYFSTFWHVAVKNVHSLLGHGSLKSVISQEWIDGMSYSFAFWYKFRNAKC